MQLAHQQEKKQFFRLFEREGIDDIDQRMVILEVFLNIEGHISFNGLIDALDREGYDFKPDFVKQTLNLLCRYGFASKKHFKGQPTLYEHRQLGSHHDHLICTRCNKIVEFQNQQMEDMQLEIAALHGFHVLQHRMEMYGLCGDCLKGRVQLMPLSHAQEGEGGIIQELMGGSGAQLRLATLGLRKGDHVEVITNNGQGQLVLAVNATRLAMGRGVAKKILVKPNGLNRRV
jgi:Fur family transcriptional regulator, ferric uptake regulator